jgi:CheY-like chemotaxis protein
MAGDKERFLAAGMSEYLAKPVQIEELKMTLSRVTEMSGIDGVE